MDEPQKVPGFRRSRRRAVRKPSIAESISKSRTTILINMVIEAACAVILIIGFLYLIRFLIFWKERMVELHFKIFLGTAIFFAIGWSFYIFWKLFSHYKLLKKVSQHDK